MLFIRYKRRSAVCRRHFLCSPRLEWAFILQNICYPSGKKNRNNGSTWLTTIANWTLAAATLILLLVLVYYWKCRHNVGQSVSTKQTKRAINEQYLAWAIEEVFLSKHQFSHRSEISWIVETTHKRELGLYL